MHNLLCTSSENRLSRHLFDLRKRKTETHYTIKHRWPDGHSYKPLLYKIEQHQKEAIKSIERGFLTPDKVSYLEDQYITEVQSELKAIGIANLRNGLELDEFQAQIVYASLVSLVVLTTSIDLPIKIIQDNHRFYQHKKDIEKKLALGNFPHKNYLEYIVEATKADLLGNQTPYEE